MIIILIILIEYNIFFKYKNKIFFSLIILIGFIFSVIILLYILYFSNVIEKLYNNVVGIIFIILFIILFLLFSPLIIFNL